MNNEGVIMNERNSTGRKPKGATRKGDPGFPTALAGLLNGTSTASAKKQRK